MGNLDQRFQKPSHNTGPTLQIYGTNHTASKLAGPYINIWNICFWTEHLPQKTANSADKPHHTSITNSLVITS